MKTYLVTATHPVARFNLNDAKIDVGQNGDNFYAKEAELGCGKNRPSAAKAIQELLYNQGYTHIVSIQSSEPTTVPYLPAGRGTVLMLEFAHKWAQLQDMAPREAETSQLWRSFKLFEAEYPQLAALAKRVQYDAFDAVNNLQGS